MTKSAGLIAYVTDAQDLNTLATGLVIPVDLSAEPPPSPPPTPIPIYERSMTGGSGTNAIIVTKDGATAYVTNEYTASPFGTVSRIDLATGKVRWSIAVGSEPVDIQFVPGSRETWAWVANYNGPSISMINLAKGEVVNTLTMPGKGPNTVAFTPDGKKCYVANWATDNPAGSSVTLVDVQDGGASGKILTSIRVGLNPNWIAITNHGATAYVANKGSKSLTPIDVVTNEPMADIPMPGMPIQIEVSPNGKLAYVAIAGDGTDMVVPLDLTVTPAKPGKPIALAAGCQPHWIAFGPEDAPDGLIAYVVGNGDSTLTPIPVKTGIPGKPIKVSDSSNADILDIAIVKTK